ncbi:popeye domain-containing protein 3-like [Planococcus citri]|uniref:popeye domain-containing protein 3-like n=1 Tax=Planococcus citri TaxID=170843 RepID=UPI0031F7B17C
METTESLNNLNESLDDDHILSGVIDFNVTAFIPGTYCGSFRESEHWLFQVANACFLVAYAVPTTKYCIIFMHSLLILGFMFVTTWAWRVMCAPDMFSWSLCFLCLNAFHLIYIIYQMRPINFDHELEEAYHTLFRPFKVSRLQFKKLVSEPFAQIMSLHAGEAYAMQNLTRTDRLALLLSGKVNVLQDHQFLHPIMPCEFLDSPEFESRVNEDDKFKVSIIAAVPCRYLYWQRSSLEYLFVKETYLATVVATLVATDITNKLYMMNNKIVTEKGSHLDIRLPSITSALATSRDRTTSAKMLRKHSEFLSNACPSSPDSMNSSRERLIKCMKNSPMPNGKLNEMEPLTELPSMDDLTSGASGVESWLDTSSKYHSCELLDS